MGLKVQRNDDLDSMFGKFAQDSPEDPNRDKFFKRDDKKETKKKKSKGLFKRNKNK